MVELILLLSLCRDARDLSADAWGVRHAAHRRLAAAGVRGVWAARLCVRRSDPEAAARLHRLCGCYAAVDVPPDGLPGIGLLCHAAEDLDGVPPDGPLARLADGYLLRYRHPDHSAVSSARSATCDLVRDLRYHGVPRWGTPLLTGAMRLRLRAGG